MVSLFDPHNPYDDHPPEYDARVDAGALPPLLPAQRETWPEGICRHGDDDDFASFDVLSTEEVQRMRVGYLDKVAYVDDTVGLILKLLDERRLTGRLAAGRQLAGPVQLNDITAMLLAAAGVEADLPDAIDPTPAIRGEVGGRDVAINAHRNSGLASGHFVRDPPIHLTVATDGRWKLCHYHAAPGDAIPRGGRRRWSRWWRRR